MTGSTACIRARQEHIDGDRRGNENLRPSAIAAHEQLPSAGLATVELVGLEGFFEARLIVGRIAFCLTAKEGIGATEFLRRFDRDKPVEATVYRVLQHMAEEDERETCRARVKENGLPLQQRPRTGRLPGAKACSVLEPDRRFAHVRADRCRAQGAQVARTLKGRPP